MKQSRQNYHHSMLLVFRYLEHLQCPSGFPGVGATQCPGTPAWGTPTQGQITAMTKIPCSIPYSCWAPFQTSPKIFQVTDALTEEKCRAKYLMKCRACLPLGNEVFLRCKRYNRATEQLCKFSRNTEQNQGFGFAELSLIPSYRKTAALQELELALHILVKDKRNGFSDLYCPRWGRQTKFLLLVPPLFQFRPKREPELTPTTSTVNLGAKFLLMRGLLDTPMHLWQLQNP